MARALYIHWPFCLKKCPYCDFNSHVRDGVDHAAWQRALVADMRHEAALAGGEPLTSIFFGGGTPSLMPPALIAHLLAQAERLWGFSDETEITLEANPSTVEAAAFGDLAAAGINRVSLGLQALDDTALRFLGRLHGVREGLAALEIAQRNFARVSFDLIYARPGQTPAAWQAELSRALGFGTDHLSLYQLTIEPNTRFATDVRLGHFAPLDDDPAAELFELSRAITADAGLLAYEVSNHARRGQESRHNLTYWRYRDYCGIGPGAHGRRGGMATSRHKKPENWLAAVSEQGHGIREEAALSPATRASEALLMGLRLSEGVSLADIAARLELDPARLIDRTGCAMLERLGFVQQVDGRLVVTDKGVPVLDAVLGELVHPELVAA
ncbi:radical SAM family heme chaperone HemW [Pelagerythrobacter rhizovicinus]|uniref:Heme chaperone HemW n=1 Tax=Pelagerythrobacter rhizovicinus TaxID=2268576 RepID=A0A4Q2KLE8_9SPHN|nr:radical SAM family heme chaperone HemW [Pelagerythrobacter rhizovicinus]RXZ66135.1 coproporphyrinogen III oxidase [Pelagerythrobacter rhizovicinus]